MAASKFRIDEVQRALPPLERAYRLQEEAADVGLDWPEAEDVWSRINEELAEVKAASEDISILGSRLAARAERDGPASAVDAKGLDSAHTLLREELGNLLFAVVDVCRTLHIDPRAALEIANEKFAACFEYVRDRTASEGIILGLESPERLKELWLEARLHERRSEPLQLWKCSGDSGETVAEDTVRRA
jgi:tetrapyrrole methylase family protein/MazG family protein